VAGAGGGVVRSGFCAEDLLDGVVGAPAVIRGDWDIALADGFNVDVLIGVVTDA
jgi:hypothetical protein